jgi:hypothetical protein
MKMYRMLVIAGIVLTQVWSAGAQQKGKKKVATPAPAVVPAGKQDATEELPSGTKEGWSRMAKLGRGFVVWESNRTGKWRIWHRALDGSDLRQLTADETDRDHLAPHISPDGTRVVFISVPHALVLDWREDAPDGIPLYVINVDGSGLRKLAEHARTYGGDRSVVWLDKDNLIYLSAGKGPTKLNLVTGAEDRLPPSGLWLVNRTMTHATTGQPTFSPYDSATGKISEQAPFGGCEPYFSADGVWGFWMGGAGGPINRIRLGSRQVTPIINLHDARMPAGRAYLYFPMVSRNQRLFACGASPDQHDHGKSDYDIFVAPLNPDTLELLDNPVRYTFSPGTDRYPDVFLADFELGTFEGEAPFEVQFTSVEQPANWTWNFGDGTPVASKPKHTFTRPGDYDVLATQQDKTLRGRVRVRPAQAPVVLSAFLRGDREVVVEFDEPINIERIHLDLPKGIRVASKRADRQRLVLTLDSELKQAATLGLSGVGDLAQKPNTLSATNIVVQPLEWPSDRDGLVFAWRTAAIALNAVNPANGKPVVGNVTRLKAARLDHDYALVLDGGFCAVTNADTVLLEACRRSNELTIETTITPANITQEGPARIVTFSSDTGSRNFTLGQTRSQLVLRLRTPQSGLNGTPPDLELCSIEANRTYHVVVTYSGGRVVCYVDGAKKAELSNFQGDFSNWSPHHLVLGDEWGGERNWSGVLEGVALFSRALNAGEAAREFQAYQQIRARRSVVPRVVVEAELLSASTVPTLKQIAPYREGLMVCEYRVDKVVEGKLEARKIRVAHWALLDGTPRGAASRQAGWSGRLDLERFEANPQLKSLFLSDTLPDDFGVELFYDPSI